MMNNFILQMDIVNQFPFLSYLTVSNNFIIISNLLSICVKVIEQLLKLP